MKKTFLIYCAMLFSMSMHAQYITFNGAEISSTTLITSQEDLTPAIKQKLICIGAVIDWTSPLTQTIKISVSPDIFGQTIVCGDDVFFFEDIIDVNNGVIKKPGGGESDNFNFKLSIDPPNDGSVGDGIPNLTDWNLALSTHSVKVGIFDTGFVPDIANGTPSESNSFDYVNNSDQVTVDHYHGSHVASVAYGMVKEDQNAQNIQYYNYKILDENGHGLLSDIIISAEEAITNHGVNILNFSLSGLNTSGITSYLKDMVVAAQDYNALFVFSAGNDEVDINSGNVSVVPASLTGPNVITVASGSETNNKYKISEFSNYGYTSVDILAPGENITGVDDNGQDLTLSGTSQAAAVITGIASILGTYQSDFNGSHLKCALNQGVNKLSSLIGLINSEGIVNTEGALEELQSTNPCEIDTDFLISSKKAFIYPNPNLGTFNLNISEGEYLFEVYDIVGSKVYSKTIISTGEIEQINTSLTTKGLFHIHILNKESQKATKLKFVKY